MKIDFKQVLKSADGKTLKFDEHTEVSLGKLAANGLASVEQGISGEEKYKRGKLAFKLFSADEAELKVEEIALLKKVIADSAGNSLIVFQAWDMLEKKDEEKIAEKIEKEIAEKEE